MLFDPKTSGEGLLVLMEIFSRCGGSRCPFVSTFECLLAKILGDNCKMFEIELKDDFLATGGFPEPL
jgi:hypothetical protein